jgi:hypothetical protein
MVSPDQIHCILIRSVGLDEHMNNKVSSETGVISHVKNSPIFDNAMRMPGKNSGIFKTSANFYENRVLHM